MLQSFAELKTFLEGRNIPVRADDERQVLEIPTYIRGEQHLAVIVWDPRATLMHVIQPLAVDVHPDRVAEIADALVRVNHQLVLPGFGYDHDRNTVYFRWVVPREGDGGMSEEGLDRAIRTVLETCRDFMPGLRAVAANMPSSEVIPFSARLKEEERQTVV